MMICQTCICQKLSFQTGSSSDLYFASKSNNSFNNKPETYSNLLGLNVSYTFTLDTIKQNEIILFIDLYRFNFGTSVRSYPETENMDITKLSNPGVLSPCLGIFYGFPIHQHKKFSTFLMLGGSARFNLFPMSASGTFTNQGENGVDYLILNQLEKTNPISFSMKVAGQLRYKINEGTNLLFTPLASIGTFNWYKQRYIYQLTKDNEIIEEGTNTMNNNGSRFQMLVGVEINL